MKGKKHLWTGSTFIHSKKICILDRTKYNYENFCILYFSSKKYSCVVTGEKKSYQIYIYISIT